MHQKFIDPCYVEIEMQVIYQYNIDNGNLGSFC
jgi:hypothetical protein